MDCRRAITVTDNTDVASSKACMLPRYASSVLLRQLDSDKTFCSGSTDVGTGGRGSVLADVEMMVWKKGRDVR